MSSDIRSAIMQNLVETVAGIDGVNGAVDDVPWDYAKPPLPFPNLGTNRHPFAYIFEGEEAPEPNEYVAQYLCRLPVTVECTFEYSETDGTQGMKIVGRALLADIQRALMADPNRGGRCSLTIETFNAVEETTVAQLGVVVWKGQLTYVRAKINPDSRAAA